MRAPCHAADGLAHSTDAAKTWSFVDSALNLPLDPSLLANDGSPELSPPHDAAYDCAAAALSLNERQWWSWHAAAAPQQSQYRPILALPSSLVYSASILPVL